MYLCGFDMMKQTRRISNLPATLGGDRGHYLFLAASHLALVPFARKIQRVLRRNFAFLGNFTPVKTDGALHFPLFFAGTGKGPGEYLVMLPNRIAVRPVLRLRPGMPSALPLFDDDRYFFNRQGQYLMKCGFVDYDYAFLLVGACDGGCGEVLGPLRECEGLRVGDIGPAEESVCARRSGNLSEATGKELLFNFFGDVDVMVNDYRAGHLLRRLAPNRSPKAAGVGYADLQCRDSYSMNLHNRRFSEAGIWHDDEEWPV